MGSLTLSGVKGEVREAGGEWGLGLVCKMKEIGFKKKLKIKFQM